MAHGILLPEGEGLITLSFDSSIAADEIPTSSFNDYQRPVLNTIHAVLFSMSAAIVICEISRCVTYDGIQSMKGPDKEKLIEADKKEELQRICLVAEPISPEVARHCL